MRGELEGVDWSANGGLAGFRWCWVPRYVEVGGEVRVVPKDVSDMRDLLAVKVSLSLCFSFLNCILLYCGKGVLDRGLAV